MHRGRCVRVQVSMTETGLMYNRTPGLQHWILLHKLLVSLCARSVPQPQVPSLVAVYAHGSSSCLSRVCVCVCAAGVTSEPLGLLVLGGATIDWVWMARGRGLFEGQQF